MCKEQHKGAGLFDLYRSIGRGQNTGAGCPPRVDQDGGVLPGKRLEDAFLAGTSIGVESFRFQHQLRTIRPGPFAAQDNPVGVEFKRSYTIHPFF